MITTEQFGIGSRQGTAEYSIDTAMNERGNYEFSFRVIFKNTPNAQITNEAVNANINAVVTAVKDLLLEYHIEIITDTATFRSNGIYTWTLEFGSLGGNSTVISTFLNALHLCVVEITS